MKFQRQGGWHPWDEGEEVQEMNPLPTWRDYVTAIYLYLINLAHKIPIIQ